MKLISALCATAGIALLAGCASYETPAPAVAVATPAIVTPTSNMTVASVYYDQFYGPIYAGYWGSDGLFHYQMVAGGPWLIDSSRHFRRDLANGYQVVTLTPVIVPAA